MKVRAEGPSSCCSRRGGLAPLKYSDPAERAGTNDVRIQPIRSSSRDWHLHRDQEHDSSSSTPRAATVSVRPRRLKAL